MSTIRALRRLVSRQASLNKKLRKAVVSSKHRLIAELLEDGACPTWLEDTSENSDEMNALLLACEQGDPEILNLLLNSFFEAPQMLNHWGRQMYYTVIRNGHWKTFRRMYDRKVPLNPIGSTRSKLPSPAFIAAEVGQADILQFLVKTNPEDAAGYSFNGHSLLSIASKNGHYECVEILLSMIMVTDMMLDFAIDVARANNQPHVIVLLTSCLPQYNSSTDPVVHRRPSGASSRATLLGYSDRGSLSKPRRSGEHPHHNRGSLAETEILSDDDYEHRSSQDQHPRRSTYQTEQDLQVYHPYSDSDEDDVVYESVKASQYEAYIQRLESAESEPDWTSTPPDAAYPIASRSLRSLSIESEEKTEETLTRIAKRREIAKQALRKSEEKKKKSTWFYHNEVILPYDESDTNVPPTEKPVEKTVAPVAPPTSTKPPLPPSTTTTRHSTLGFQMPSSISQVSRKIISIRSKNLQLHRSSM